jgi:hypothetical protein
MGIDRTIIGVVCVDCGKQFNVQRGNSKKKTFKSTCKKCVTKRIFQDPVKKERILKNHIHHLPNGEANFNEIFKNYKHSADQKGLVFKLGKDEFKKLTKQNCIYCGSEPNKISYMRNRELKYGYYKYNGLDRLDSSVGYIIDNIVPCCQRCNFMKMKMLKDEFLEQVEKIYLYNQIGGK